MPDQPPPAPVGPPPDYFMTPPVPPPPPDAPGYAMPPPPLAYQGVPAYVPVAAAGVGAAGLIAQFGGAAGGACLAGLISIIVPFVFGRVFFFLPIIGILSGIRAIRRGKVIGGTVGIVLSAIGGLITIVGLMP